MGTAVRGRGDRDFFFFNTAPEVQLPNSKYIIRPLIGRRWPVVNINKSADVRRTWRVFFAVRLLRSSGRGTAWYTPPIYGLPFPLKLAARLSIYIAEAGQRTINGSTVRFRAEPCSFSSEQWTAIEKSPDLPVSYKLFIHIAIFQI